MLGRALDSVNARPTSGRRSKRLRGTPSPNCARFARQCVRRAQQLATLLKAETIDKAAIERLRSERVTAMDAMSRRMAEAVTQGRRGSDAGPASATDRAPGEPASLDARMTDGRGLASAQRSLLEHHPTRWIPAGGPG